MSVLFRCLLFFCLVNVSKAACGLGAACKNGGSCISGDCTCVAGFTGELCDFAIDFSLTADTSYAETQGSAIVTVTRTVLGFPLALTVSASGTATITDDFSLSATNIQFQNADTSKTVTITLVDDEVSENDETIILSVAATDGTSQTGTYTILESDPVTLSVSGSTTFMENDGTAAITIVCTLPSATPTASFTVAAVDGTALTGTDYNFSPPPPTTCSNTQSLAVMVVLINDNTPETSEQFSVTLSSTLPFSGLTGSSVGVTIVDDDSLQISLSLPDEVSEGSGDINFAGTTFVFVNGESVHVTITVTVAGGTAVQNSEFTLSDPSGSVTFTYIDGDPTSRQNLDNFVISFPEDSVLEPDKTLIVTFTSDYPISGTTTKTITVKDNELETVTLTGASSVSEDQGTATYTLTRTVPFRAITVTYTVTAASIDRTLYNTNVDEVTGTVDFATGELSKTFSVTLVDDDLVQSAVAKSFTLSVTGDRINVVQDETVTITEDDSYTVTFSALAVTEGEVITVQFTRDITSGDLTISVATADVTAVDGSDYTAQTTSLQFGQNVDTVSLQIPTREDQVFENSETLTVSITSSSVTLNPASTSSETMTIIDDDVETLTITGGGNVNENVASITLTITRTATFEQLIVTADTVIPSSSGNAPITADDIVMQTGVQLTFAIGAGSVTFTVAITDDATVEPNEDFLVTIDAPGAIVDVQATVTIVNDDIETLTITGGGNVNENAGSKTLTITRTATFEQLIVTADTVIPSSSGNALITADDIVMQTGVQLTFAIGAGSVTFTVAITDDATVEPDEDFVVTIDAPDPIVDVSAVVTIVNDDVETLTITGGGNVNENAGSKTLTITRTATFEQLIVTADTVIPSSSGNVPITADDIVVQTGVQLTFAIGAGSVTFTVVITDDATVEPNEDFLVTIDAPGAIVDVQASLTIVNDDIETLTITGGGNVNENVGSKTLTITRTATFEQLIVTAETVIPSSSGNVPITADDIVMQTGVQLTFAIGAGSVTFTVVITDDATVEPDEDFVVTIDAPDPIVDVSAVVTIVNDDADVVTLPTFLAVLEDGSSKVITITRTVSDKEVTVQVNTNDVTAKAGTDYTALTNYDVTFGVGSLTATFTVTIQDDEVDEDDETFTLVVSGDTVVTTDPYTFKIIDDEGSRPFDCRRYNQDCTNSADVCLPDIPVCECKGTPAREGDMCNIITDQKNGAACSSNCNSQGVCLDNSGSTSCACYPGYYGDNCEHYFLKAVCSSEDMILITNPHGNFTGRIHVKGKSDISACTATSVPDPPQPDDNIDDDLKGFALTVRHDSTACGVITPQEDTQTTQTKYTRQFRIQYDPDITTGLDQCVTITCSFDRNNVLVDSGVLTIDPNGPFVEESAGNEFSPLTLAVDIDGTPVTEASTVVLAKKLCVTIRVPQDFGGIEIIDIEFNNTLPGDPIKWAVYTSGCAAKKSVSVLVNEPFYSESGNKRAMKFCFFAFKFVNSAKLTVQVKVKVCVDPDDCQLGTCARRRKRQIVTSRETTVKATFNILDPVAQTSERQQNETDADVSSEAVCKLPFEFVPTVLCLGVLNFVLLFLCIYLTCRLAHKASNKLKKPIIYHNR